MPSRRSGTARDIVHSWLLTNESGNKEDKDDVVVLVIHSLEWVIIFCEDDCIGISLE
jgi:hypothetical protein